MLTEFLPPEQLIRASSASTLWRPVTGTLPANPGQAWLPARGSSSSSSRRKRWAPSLLRASVKSSPSSSPPKASSVQVTLYSYNWSLDLGAALNRDLVRLVKWQNARAHVVQCLLNQKMGLFHHHCFSDAPIHEMESKQVKSETHTAFRNLFDWVGGGLGQASRASSRAQSR